MHHHVKRVALLLLDISSYVILLQKCFGEICIDVKAEPMLSEIKKEKKW